MSISSNAEAEAQQITGFAYREVTPGQAGAADPGQGMTQQKDVIQAAVREGEARAQALFAQKLAQEHELVSKAVADFKQERNDYYQKIEVEVVQLALAIARRILHREAAADPLLLAGIVRVALDKLENKTEVVLRVHPNVASEWRAFFASKAEPGHAPEVVEDSTLGADHCLLQTSLGSTELGLETQLKEVEQGLSDLQAQRPKVMA
jgi:flagellar assembly protein FliH